MQKSHEKLLLETLQALVNEIGGIRAEIAVMRKHSGASFSRLNDRERFAHLAPPAGAKNGYWLAVAGELLPQWVEKPLPVWDFTARTVRSPVSDALP